MRKTLVSLGTLHKHRILFDFDQSLGTGAVKGESNSSTPAPTGPARLCGRKALSKTT